MPSVNVEFLRAIHILKNAGIQTPQLDAELLLAHACRASRLEIITNPDRQLDRRQFLYFRRLLEARRRRTPLAYLLKKQEFWGLELEISSTVLVPRSDTETVVEAALDFLKSRDKPCIVDIGTGSGAIALALAKELPEAEVLAIDISEKALRTAKRNARRNNLRIRFLRCDILEPGIANTMPMFDAVCSNPPYIPSDEIDSLQPEVSDYEPRIALDGGKDGLDFHRAIAVFAEKRLKKGGRVFIETAAGQAEKVQEMYNNTWLKYIGVRRDLAGIARVLIAERRGI